MAGRTQEYSPGSEALIARLDALRECSAAFRERLEAHAEGIQRIEHGLACSPEAAHTTQDYVSRVACPKLRATIAALHAAIDLFEGAMANVGAEIGRSE